MWSVFITCNLIYVQFLLHNAFSFLACLFRRKSQAIVIAILLPSCSPFFKKLKISTPNLEYLLLMTRCSCKTRGITMKTTVLELCPFLTKNFKQKQKDSPWQMSVGTTYSALVLLNISLATAVFLLLYVLFYMSLMDTMGIFVYIFIYFYDIF